MSSFSMEVKNELARTPDDKPCCKVAELAALMRMGGALALGEKKNFGVNFTTENAAVARKTLTLLKESFAVQTEVTVSRARRLKKNNSYFIRVVPAPVVGKLLTRLGILQDENFNVAGDGKILRRDCCRCAYLRGAFLGGGSVNKPEGECHLELVTGSYNFARTLHSLCKKFELPVKMTDRKNDYLVYLKDGEAILEFLGIVGADDALVEFEVARNVKDVRNQVNRLVNCETANLQKTVNAACRQMERIKLIEEKIGLEHLPGNLKEIAMIRLKHPEATLKELVAAMDNRVGKSGVNHRLRKLEQIAIELIEDDGK